MTEATETAPDTMHATGDPGDDTAMRYRYQWTFAAIVCCMLLDDTLDVAEVFCEHHEDVLIKHNDGLFSGLQIKTKQSDQDFWKTSDEAVIGSFVRFSRLENEFPGRFRAFLFLSNHPLHSARNGQDINYVLQMIKSATALSDLSSPVARLLARIAKEAGCTAEVVFVALTKAQARDDLPKLADIEVRLIDTLTGIWNCATDCPYNSVRRAARHLASECGRASSLSHQDILPAYLPVTPDPEGMEFAARLAVKRLERIRVLEILDAGLNMTAPLDGDPESLVEPGTGATDLLLKKLDAGGFSAVSRNSALDLRDKADYLGIVWTKKHGRGSGLQRYTHVRSIVLSDAARAFEGTQDDEHPFGVKMLSELRSLFKERRAEGSPLYDCSDEHLEGFAYSLTSQCKVQWSIDRPWETE